MIIEVGKFQFYQFQTKNVNQLNNMNFILFPLKAVKQSKN